MDNNDSNRQLVVNLITVIVILFLAGFATYYLIKKNKKTQTPIPQEPTTSEQPSSQTEKPSEKESSKSTETQKTAPRSTSKTPMSGPAIPEPYPN